MNKKTRDRDTIAKTNIPDAYNKMTKQPGPIP